MRRHFLLILFLALANSVGVVAQSKSDEINTLASAARVVAEELQQRANCDVGRSMQVGIWPLDSQSLPITKETATQIYQMVLVDLIAAKPACVTFLDGAGASGTLDYLNKTGAFRVLGTTPREEIEAAFRGVDFILSISIYDRPTSIVAALKLASPRGQTFAAPAAFAIPEALFNQACGAGALPLDTAFERAARTLADAAPDMRTLVNEGGMYGDTEERTSFAGYAGRLIVDDLVRAYSDPISGRQLLVAEEAKSGDREAYRLRFRYWPCASSDRLIISMQLVSGVGAAASWNGAVLTGGLPDNIDLAPVPDPREIWSLSVTPKRATVGDQLAFVAEMPARCSPVFVDFGPYGKATVIPEQFFAVEDTYEGGRRYRVDDSTRYGIEIMPGDEKGIHQLGYFCTSDDESASVDLLRSVWLEMAAGTGRQIQDLKSRNFWFEKYEVR